MRYAQIAAVRSAEPSLPDKGVPYENPPDSVSYIAARDSLYDRLRVLARRSSSLAVACAPKPRPAQDTQIVSNAPVHLRPVSLLSVHSPTHPGHTLDSVVPGCLTEELPNICDGTAVMIQRVLVCPALPLSSACRSLSLSLVLLRTSLLVLNVVARRLRR